MRNANFQQERFNRPQAASYVGLQPTTLEADATRHQLGIPYYRVGRRVFYRKSDLDHWLETRCRIDVTEGGCHV
jgi:hypothetical protein